MDVIPTAVAARVLERTAVPEANGEFKRHVDAELRAAVLQLDESIRRVVSYHFGWTTADGRQSNGDHGKMLRSAIVIRCAQGVGGSLNAALPGAVAVELAHNSSLLQDDVMDHDQLRRHRPTAWTVFGESAALLAGDALIVLAFSVLLRHGNASGVAAASVLAETYRQLVIGQALDLDFETRSSVTPADCYRMVDGKTASLVACAAHLGALLGGADTATITALEAYGRHLGLAFQLADDMLGIWGDPTQTGKPVGADIRTRKKSLPVTYALSVAPPGDDLIGFYARPHMPDEAEIRPMTARLESLGALDWGRAEADRHLQAARRSLDAAHLASTSRQELLTLTDLACIKTRHAPTDPHRRLHEAHISGLPIQRCSGAAE